MVIIALNGESARLPEGATVADLLASQDLDRVPCAVEVNRKVIPKRLHDSHVLHDGDAIEIVSFVGGG